ncbi:MAG: amidase family protein [Acidiferrobacterales bacterium]
MFQKTIAELHAALKAKEISSVELTQLYLDRIAAHKNVNAYITVTSDSALAQAKAADKILASGKGGALTGVPMSHKDIFLH